MEGEGTPPTFPKREKPTSLDHLYEHPEEGSVGPASSPDKLTGPQLLAATRNSGLEESNDFGVRYKEFHTGKEGPPHVQVTAFLNRHMGKFAFKPLFLVPVTMAGFETPLVLIYKSREEIKD